MHATYKALLTSFLSTLTPKQSRYCQDEFQVSLFCVLIHLIQNDILLYLHPETLIF